MANHYYYLVASLPSIEFDGKASMSAQELLEDAQRLLSKEDFLLMNDVLMSKVTADSIKNKTLAAWLRFNHELRNEMAWFRAEKTKQDPSDHLRGDRSANPQIIDQINQAYKESNLLNGEKVLDKIRWDFLSDLVVDQFFTFEYLVVYGLKLTILDKYKEYASAKGAERFEDLKEVHMSLIGQNN